MEIENEIENRRNQPKRLITVPVTDDEYSEIEQAANRARLGIAPFLRQTALDWIGMAGGDDVRSAMIRLNLALTESADSEAKRSKQIADAIDKLHAMIGGVSEMLRESHRAGLVAAQEAISREIDKSE